MWNHSTKWTHWTTPEHSLWTIIYKTPGGWFNINMSSYQYRKSHCGDKTILRPSYLHNGISYTGKMTSLYWIRALVVQWDLLIIWMSCGVSDVNILWGLSVIACASSANISLVFYRSRSCLDGRSLMLSERCPRNKLSRDRREKVGPQEERGSNLTLYVLKCSEGT